MSKILSICAKCSDCCHSEIVIDGEVVKELDGYVPRNFGIGGGDYIEFHVDLETGKIVGWTEPELSDED